MGEGWSKLSRVASYRKCSAPLVATGVVVCFLSHSVVVAGFVAADLFSVHSSSRKPQLVIFPFHVPDNSVRNVAVFCMCVSALCTGKA